MSRKQTKKQVADLMDWLINVRDMLPGKFTVKFYPLVAIAESSPLANQEWPLELPEISDFNMLPVEIMRLIEEGTTAMSGGRDTKTLVETTHPHLLIMNVWGMNGDRLAKEIFQIHCMFKPDVNILKRPLMLPGGQLVHAV